LTWGSIGILTKCHNQVFELNFRKYHFLSILIALVVINQIMWPSLNQQRQVSCVLDSNHTSNFAEQSSTTMKGSSSAVTDCSKSASVCSMSNCILALTPTAIVVQQPALERENITELPFPALSHLRSSLYRPPIFS